MRKQYLLQTSAQCSPNQCLVLGDTYVAMAAVAAVGC